MIRNIIPPRIYRRTAGLVGCKKSETFQASKNWIRELGPFKIIKKSGKAHITFNYQQVGLGISSIQ